MHVNTALQKFQIQLEADGRSTHTRQQYERHIRLMAHWLVTRRHSSEVEAVDHEDVARFLSSPQARTRPDGGQKRATSVNALRTSIRVFFGYLHRAGYLRQDPARLVRRAQCGPAPPRALSEIESERLMATLAQGEGPEAERDHAMFHLMLATGIRLGSAVNLDVEDVDLEAEVLHLRNTKGDHPEQMFLSMIIQDHLRKYIGGRTSGPLFAGRHGQHLTTRQVQRRFKMWTRQARITRHATVHSLRHRFALNIYSDFGDIFLVQSALRHRSITSTMIYARMDENRLRQAFRI